MNRIHPTLLTLTTALLFGISAAGSADTVYRWVDENGVVNYTQQKPRNVDAVPITTPGRRSASTSRPDTRVQAEPPQARPAVEQPLTPEQEKMLEGLKAAEQARQEEIARIKAQNCQQSKDVLARLTVKARIRVRGEDGEYRVMPEDERQSRIDEAQKNVALYCTSG